MTMNACLDYILDLEEPQQRVAQFLYDLLLEFPDLHCRITHQIPFFYRKKWVCYLNPTKDGRVELAFTRGHLLSNEQGLLESKGRKQVSSSTFLRVEDIPVDALLEIIQEAILLDEEIASGRPDR
jgi:hypothetical protein